MSGSAPSMHSKAAGEMAGRLGLRLGRANLEVFAETLLGLAEGDRDVLAVTSDSRGSGKLTAFAKALPGQIVELGIAEQNLVGVAAGLASAGKRVYAVSPACFLTARALEQIKNDVAYSDQRVKVIGISAGVSYGALGSTHHSLHDIAALRAVNNIDVVAPGDNFEAREAIRAAMDHPRPVYVRFGKAALYDLYEGAGLRAKRHAERSEASRPSEIPSTGSGQALRFAQDDNRAIAAAHSGGKAARGIVKDVDPTGQSVRFEIGRGLTVREGKDVAFIATGETVIHALLAAGLLKEEQGLECRVVSMHTIKPLDAEAVLSAGRGCGAVVTVEEHSVHGGLGEACAGVLMQAGVSVPLRIVGIPDEYTVTGSQADIFQHYGINMEGLARVGMELVR